MCKPHRPQPPCIANNNCVRRKSGQPSPRSKPPQASRVASESATSPASSKAVWLALPTHQLKTPKEGLRADRHPRVESLSEISPVAPGARRPQDTFAIPEPNRSVPRSNAPSSDTCNRLWDCLPPLAPKAPFVINILPNNGKLVLSAAHGQPVHGKPGVYTPPSVMHFGEDLRITLRFRRTAGPISLSGRTYVELVLGLLLGGSHRWPTTCLGRAACKRLRQPCNPHAPQTTRKAIEIGRGESRR